MQASYSNARDISWHVIKKYNIDYLPVDVFVLAMEMGIKVMPYSTSKWLMMLMGIRHLCRKNDGLYVKFLKERYIFYNDALTSEGRVRFTIAHEIGHHVLGHLGRGVAILPRCAERSKVGRSSAREKEANIFASRLLAPSGVLHELGITKAEDIARMCGMSKEAATYRASRLSVLDSRDRYYTSDLERKAVENFREFIEENKIRITVK